MPDVCSGKVQFKNLPVEAPDIVLQAGDSLLIVDVQRDFLAGGSLAVPGAEEVLEPLNRYLAMFVQRNLPVFASGDCHPPDHCSFQEQGGPWPAHCVINTNGAAFAEVLGLPDSANVVRKGTASDREAHSAFDGTDLQARLCAAKVLRVFIGGLAPDHGVPYTARDAIELGFKVFVLRDAVRAVYAGSEEGPKAERELSDLGASFIQLKDLLHAH